MSHDTNKTTDNLHDQSRSQSICHVTTVHPRNDTRILLKECVSLTVAGYKVHLIVGDGQGDALIGSIQIHDIGAKPNSRIKRMWLQPKRALEKVLALRPDIVHFHDPELLFAGVKLAKKDIRVLYDVHEDVPKQTITKYWIPRGIRPVIAKAVELTENRLVKKLSGVVAATPHIERRFSEQAIRTVNVNNYPLLAEFAPGDGEKSRKKHVCYIGSISRMRGVLQIIQSLPFVPEVRLTLCGDIDEPALDIELRSHPGWIQVDYLGLVDRATVRRVMMESSAGIVTYLPAPNHVDAQPNKLFEYMSAELPVIASDFPLWRKIVYGAGCGLCVKPESPESIADAIRTVCNAPHEIERMGRAGRKAVIEKYNWPVEAQKLISFYRRLT